MATRTIASPGVQINELDLSIIARPEGTTNVYMAGFSKQGPTDEIINVTSTSEFENVFGGPQTAAERYFYHSAKQVLNNNGKLLVSRLPYGAELGEGFSNSYSALVYPIENIGLDVPVLGISEIGFAWSEDDETELTGEGYTVAPDVVFIGGGPNGTNPILPAKATAVLNTATSAISAIILTDSGSGYVSNPTIQLVGGNFTIVAEVTANFGIVGTVSNNYDNTENLELGQPVSILLNQDQYETLLNNDVDWNKTYDPSPIEGFDDIHKAGLVILNKAKTTINDLYEGYYIGITDNSNLNPSTEYDHIKSIKPVNNINNTLQEFSTIPASRLNFKLTAPAQSVGTGSISEAVEDIPRSFDMSLTDFNDSLILGLFKIRPSIYAQDTTILEYNLIEAYTGSLNARRTQNNPNGGSPKTFFLEDVVNNTSGNIHIVVNPNISKALNWTQSTGKPKKTVRLNTLAKHAYGLGVYTSETDKNSKKIGNLPLKLQRALRNLEIQDDIRVDIVAEAGLGTIWCGTKARKSQYNDEDIFDDTYTFAIDELYSSNNSIVAGVRDDYFSVASLFIEFAEQIRKDHIFIADGLRYVYVNGKDFKTTKKNGYNFSSHIYWPLKNLFAGIETSYATTYGNWLKTNDTFSDTQIWVPSSGYIAGVIAESDRANFPWSAPAGFNRGTITGITDIGVITTQKQRDLLYKININPIAFFPADGFVIYGQKTLYRKPSAFDRINVRRLFLHLEKSTQELLKFFLFEPNSLSTRTRIIGALTPVFEQAKVNDGVYAYQIICDERNNTPDVIDNNELKLSIYIQPVRTAEYILAEFIATRTGVDFQELIR
jgi:hypothetical protein